MQPQITVDTATLKTILRKDIEMVSNKKNAYDRQYCGLNEMLNTKVIPVVSGVLGFPGVSTYLKGLRAVAACEANLMDRQLVSLKERLSRIESDIITPGSIPGSLIS